MVAFQAHPHNLVPSSLPADVHGRKRGRWCDHPYVARFFQQRCCCMTCLYLDNIFRLHRLPSRAGCHRCSGRPTVYILGGHAVAYVICQCEEVVSYEFRHLVGVGAKPKREIRDLFGGLSGKGNGRGSVVKGILRAPWIARRRVMGSRRRANSGAGSSIYLWRTTMFVKYRTPRNISPIICCTQRCFLVAPTVR